MSKIYDNIGEDRKFRQILEDTITEPGIQRMDFCVGYFNLRGWDFIADEIDNLEGDYIYEGKDGDERKFRTARLLIGMQRAPEELIRMQYQRKPFYPDADFAQKCRRKMAEDFRRQLLIGKTTAKDEATLRQLCRQMKEEKLCVKLFVRYPLHAKLYLAHNPHSHLRKIYAYMGSSNLTYSGLTGQGELNAEMDDTGNAETLDRWFNDRWNDVFAIDITQDLIDVIENSWASEDMIPPYYIYLKTAYMLSQDARTGMTEYTLPPVFKKDLFEFQETAVKIACKHLNNEKRNGAMIGDVVGLGKTITACAIMKLMEQTTYSSSLVICPANLKDMWQKYIHKYDLKADVESMQKKLDIANMRSYRLIVIDESHNLRNSEGSRYHNIRDLIETQDCKVLLLTATPYNKDFSDLANQLRLFLNPDLDLGIRPENYINMLGGERHFLRKHTDIFIRSIHAFEQSLFAEDWRDLMKMFLVRRTRTFIKENYAKTDDANGRKYLEFNDGRRSYFPDRIPSAIKFKTRPDDQYSRLYSDKMIDLMHELKLPRYGLSKYIDDVKRQEASKTDQHILENLSRAGARMMGFCMSTFFKRIDSCGYAFLLTIYRHILRNMVFIYAIDNKLKLPISDENAVPDEFLDDDDPNEIPGGGEDGGDESATSIRMIPTDLKFYEAKAKEYYNIIALKTGASVKRVDSKYFKRSLKTQLKKDCETLIKMIQLCGEWKPTDDLKLAELEKLIKNKHHGEKVLVFSQYSDTAEYLNLQLKSRGIENVGCVTGHTSNPTQLVEQFSPKSNGANVEKELDVIVATDVLSEGQNLQDAHIIVNYDMPWAIIRLIQRAGRVDRIGQEAEKIYCYSFFPAEGVEKIIKLRKRLNDRINENANVVGSDEIFFEGNAQNLQDLFNEKAGVLDDDDDSDVDMASYAYQIWKNATDANPELKKIIPAIPDMAYSTKRNQGQSVDEGVATYAKTPSDNDMLTWLDKSGRVVSQSQVAILKAMACSADEPALAPLDCHHDILGKALNVVGETKVSTSGILGSRFSTRTKIVNLLEDFIGNPTNALFATTELKEALDQIYNYPLREGPKTTLGQMLKRGDQVDYITDYITEMYKANLLCIVGEDGEQRDARVICSMGIKNE